MPPLIRLGAHFIVGVRLIVRDIHHLQVRLRALRRVFSGLVCSQSGIPLVILRLVPLVSLVFSLVVLRRRSLRLLPTYTLLV
jgi:hypothetical protein